METPAHCNLACPYCYACGGQIERPDRLLTEAQYMAILGEAAHLGVDSLGIPGAGEPFIDRNLPLTMAIIRRASELGMFVTVFSTGEFITRELAGELLHQPVEIMLKGNTLDETEQDRFVSDPARGRIVSGYGRKRNAAIKLLMELGFNDPNNPIAKAFGRESRMALVTSILASSEASGPNNLGDLAKLLRFCRENNIIFDCDSVLERGRAIDCKLRLQGEAIKVIQQNLQAIDRTEFAREWDLSQSYVGTTCDRNKHHLYLSQYGAIRPCIGAMDVSLGDIHESDTLESAWNSQAMQIIRGRCYGGVCGTQCANFAEGSCNSCLGRRAVNLTAESLCEKGFVDTVGCWNFRPKEE